MSETKRKTTNQRKSRTTGKSREVLTPAVDNKELTSQISSLKSTVTRQIEQAREAATKIADLTQRVEESKVYEALYKSLKTEHTTLQEKFTLISQYYIEHDMKNVKWYQFIRVWNFAKFIKNTLFPNIA